MEPDMAYAIEPSHPQEFAGPAFGWQDRPDDVRIATDRIREMQRGPVIFSEAAGEVFEQQAESDDPVFFWDAEEKVLGGPLATWNQLQVGSCVGFGTTRNVQDLLLWEIACGIGEPEQWPGTELCPEVTYGGSRVEIGHSGGGGDGSTGAWASEFFIRFGPVARGVYGSLDLTKYDQAQCRRLGSRGLGSEIESIAKQHPVTQVARVTSGDEGWAAIGAGKPVPVCSNRGFTMSRNAEGFSSPSGTWNHCMATRGRFKHPDLGRCIVIGNSWGNYLNGNDTIRYVDVDGQVKTKKLPAGHFATTLQVWAGMLSQKDSYAYAGLSGWKALKLNYNPLA